MTATRTRDIKGTAPQAGPPSWARGLVYGFLWLPVFVLVLVFVPRFEPIFNKLEEKGELPLITHWLMALSRSSTALFYLPALLLPLGLLTVAEGVVRILRRKARGNLWSWLWLAAVALAAIAAALLVISGLLLPVFKMSSTVGSVAAAAASGV